MRLRTPIEGERRADDHDRIDILLRQILGRGQNSVPGRIVTLRGERAHAHAARDKAHPRIHDRAFEGYFVGRERHNETDSNIATQCQPLTRTGPVPWGRSPSLMMPRRLATSV